MFYNLSSLTHITLSSSVKNLEEGWCCGTADLIEVKICLDNPYFKLYDDKLVLGKSNKEQENFNVLVFCPRDVKTLTLPDFIEIIDPFAFEGCLKLQKLIIQTESKLRIIKKYALAHKSITTITFPSKLTEVEEGWCRCTKKLINFNVSPENPYFKSYDNKFILGKSNKEQDNFDVLVFCPRDVVKLTLPDFVEIIGPFAFNNCEKIGEIIISNESKLRIIEESSFCNSKIKSIYFSPHLTKICEKAFYNCNFLKDIQVDDNCELSFIGKNAFSNTSIESFKVPLNLTIIEESAFDSCIKLKQVEIPNNSKLQVIEKRAFASIHQLKAFQPLPISLKSLKKLLLNVINSNKSQL